jgi:hypothetical protein
MGTGLVDGTLNFPLDPKERADTILAEIIV